MSSLIDIVSKYVNKVKKEHESNSLKKMFGNPAKILRYRDEEEYYRLKAEGKQYLREKYSPGGRKDKIRVSWEEYLKIKGINR